MATARSLCGTAFRDSGNLRVGERAGSRCRHQPWRSWTRHVRRHRNPHQQSDPAPCSSFDAPVVRGRLPRTGPFTLDRLGHEHRARHGRLEREQLLTELCNRQADIDPGAADAVPTRFGTRPHGVPLLRGHRARSSPDGRPKVSPAVGKVLPVYPGSGPCSPASAAALGHQTPGRPCSARRSVAPHAHAAPNGQSVHLTTAAKMKPRSTDPTQPRAGGGRHSPHPPLLAEGTSPRPIIRPTPNVGLACSAQAQHRGGPFNRIALQQNTRHQS
jgi:hypothetical protein